MIGPQVASIPSAGVAPASGLGHEIQVRCAPVPMFHGACDADNARMRRVAIRCQPGVPAPTQELEQWLVQEVQRLREGIPDAILRLHRITGTEPTGDNSAGWLIEVDATEGDRLDRDRLDGMLRDMRLLGLGPTLFRMLESRDHLSPFRVSPTSEGDA